MPSFIENPEAYCLWAKSQANPADRLKLLSQPLRDDSWKEAPAIWVRHFAWPEFWGAESLSGAAELRSTLIQKIIGATLADDAAHAAVLEFVRTGIFPNHQASDITAWLVQHAEPNDAMTIAEVTQYVVNNESAELKKDCFPLVEWLMTKGSSELRSGRRSFLAAQLVPLVLEYGSPELIAPAIRYVLYNENRLGSDGWTHQTIEKLLPAVEQVISDSGSGALVADLVEALEPQALALYIHEVCRQWRKFPRSHAELLARLASRSITPANTVATWALAMFGPSCDIRIADASIARSAAEGLVRQMTDQGWLGSPPVPVHPDRIGWGSVVAREFIRTTELFLTRMPQDIRLLQQCAGFDWKITIGVFQAVKDAVNSANDPSLEEVRAILNSTVTEPSVVNAALELLLVGKPAKASAATGECPDHVLSAIRETLHTACPTVCDFNLKGMVQGAVEVRVESLAGERAFVIEGTTLVVAKKPLLDLLSVSTKVEDQRALGVLYAIHEVIHYFQGVAEKSNVSKVRFAGAESALMHIDLGADHVAAVIASLIFPNWDLRYLKDLQGMSVQAFPAGPRNPSFSRIRKILRFVGLRTDLAMRKLGIAKEHFTTESYGFADFSPGGGSFIALVNRPPFVVVANTTISGADASALFSSIEGGPGVIQRADEIIHRVLTAT